ncbi:MAG: hypothetical protein ACR2G4_02485 [Pyrinomonadaceae bacterium]
MANSLIEQYTKISNNIDIDECLDESHLVNKWRLIDDRRNAVEGADKLAILLGIGVPIREPATGFYPAPFGAAIHDTPKGARVSAIKDSSVSSQRIKQVIESSRSILNLQNDWDEEGSSGYTVETWGRATRFIRRVALAFKNDMGKWVDAPKITPGPDGSIDVRWKAEKRSLLINFPADDTKPADFFGSDKGSDTVQGTLDLSSQNQWLLIWLMR